MPCATCQHLETTACVGQWRRSGSLLSDLLCFMAAGHLLPPPGMVPWPAALRGRPRRCAPCGPGPGSGSWWDLEPHPRPGHWPQAPRGCGRRLRVRGWPSGSSPPPLRERAFVHSPASSGAFKARGSEVWSNVFVLNSSTWISNSTFAFFAVELGCEVPDLHLWLRKTNPPFIVFCEFNFFFFNIIYLSETIHFSNFLSPGVIRIPVWVLPWHSDIGIT